MAMAIKVLDVLEVIVPALLTIIEICSRTRN